MNFKVFSALRHLAKCYSIDVTFVDHSHEILTRMAVNEWKKPSLFIKAVIESIYIDLLIVLIRSSVVTWVRVPLCTLFRKYVLKSNLSLFLLQSSHTAWLRELAQTHSQSAVAFNSAWWRHPSAFYYFIETRNIIQWRTKVGVFTCKNQLRTQ